MKYDSDAGLRSTTLATTKHHHLRNTTYSSKDQPMWSITNCKELALLENTVHHYQPPRKYRPQWRITCGGTTVPGRGFQVKSRNTQRVIIHKRGIYTLRRIVHTKILDMKKRSVRIEGTRHSTPYRGDETYGRKQTRTGLYTRRELRIHFPLKKGSK